MTLWQRLFHRREVPHAQPENHIERERSATTSEVRLEAVEQWDAVMAATAHQVAAICAAPRPTARIFLIRSPRVYLYPLALFSNLAATG